MRRKEKEYKKTKNKGRKACSFGLKEKNR